MHLYLQGVCMHVSKISFQKPSRHKLSIVLTNDHSFITSSHYKNRNLTTWYLMVKGQLTPLDLFHANWPTQLSPLMQNKGMGAISDTN